MKTIINNISPFKDKSSNSSIEFVIQKFLAFIVLYMVSAIFLELIIIVGFILFGFDVLQGQMPAGEWVTRIPFYGMAGFASLTILYIKVIEKRKVSDIGIKLNTKLPLSFAKGIIIGVGMLAIMILLLTVSGLCSFQGFNKLSLSSAFLWFLAFFIQSSAEEIMCRGFLLTSLQRRISTKWSILISSIAFSLPHIFTIIEMEGITVWIALLNLLLVSYLFALVMIKEKSLGAACGVHFAWNYCLGTLLGLEVSGGTASSGLLRFEINSNYELLTGGIYGIEASVLLIPLLCIIVALYTWSIIRKDKKWSLQRSYLN